jgi:hypothetical protein
MKVAKRLECGQLAAAFERTPSVRQPQRSERTPGPPDVAQAGTPPEIVFQLQLVGFLGRSGACQKRPQADRTPMGNLSSEPQSVFRIF